MARRSRVPAVDSDDARTLRGTSLRTRFLQVVLVAAAVSLLALATASARGLDPGAPKLLSESSSVLVVDVSLSIGNDDYAVIRRTLRRLIDDDARVGLAIFSDVPYELLPPGTPATELRPLLRLLTPRRSRPPINPWSQSFRAGTRISTALELARDMLVRDGARNGSILLLSDLITAPEDVPQLARTLQELRRESITVRVVPLSPLKDSRAIFEGLLDRNALISPSRLEASAPLASSGGVGLPGAFLVLGGLLLAVLAAHERFAARLGLPRAGRSST